VSFYYKICHDIIYYAKDKEHFMSYEVNGETIEANEKGFLADVNDWSKELAPIIAVTEDIHELTDKHWDLINYLRGEFMDNGGNQPNTRNIVKAMTKAWGEKIDAKALYNLFPQDPSKQGGKIAGLPESRRKGGY
jgi:tRNA 2-thiouridine synthesizing protein E